MNWIRRLIHRFVGRDRYHDQATEVNNRGLRAELLHRQALAMRLDVRTRPHHDH